MLGNNKQWFTTTDEAGNSIPDTLPCLELLRDVKTRWDSVYLMLHRLRELRQVGSSQDLRLEID